MSLSDPIKNKARESHIIRPLKQVFFNYPSGTDNIGPKCGVATLSMLF